MLYRRFRLAALYAALLQQRVFRRKQHGWSQTGRPAKQEVNEMVAHKSILSSLFDMEIAS
jgi:hypothetical protein